MRPVQIPSAGTAVTSRRPDLPIAGRVCAEPPRQPKSRPAMITSPIAMTTRQNTNSHASRSARLIGGGVG